MEHGWPLRKTKSGPGSSRPREKVHERGNVRFGSFLLLAMLAATAPAPAEEAGWSVPRSLGQRIYVPVYSSIAYLNDRVFDLAVTVSIRNTDAEHPIRIETARYHDSQGEARHDYHEALRSLGPMASRVITIAQSDLRGDIGANLIVEWRAEMPATPPVIETVMVGSRGTQGLAFTSRGVVLAERR
jgi:hypothetical protein